LPELRHTKVYSLTVRAANGQFMPSICGTSRLNSPTSCSCPDEFSGVYRCEAKKFRAPLIMNGNSSLIGKMAPCVACAFSASMVGTKCAQLNRRRRRPFFRVRHLLGIQPVATSPPMDVLCLARRARLKIRGNRN
jgi:hypothetical protein